jgi:hypothetical protein
MSSRLLDDLLRVPCGFAHGYGAHADISIRAEKWTPDPQKNFWVWPKRRRLCLGSSEAGPSTCDRLAGGDHAPYTQFVGLTLRRTHPRRANFTKEGAGAKHEILATSFLHWSRSVRTLRVYRACSDTRTSGGRAHGVLHLCRHLRSAGTLAHALLDAREVNVPCATDAAKIRGAAVSVAIHYLASLSGRSS